MVANFVSANYRWLYASDRHSACHCLKPGKNHEGYFSNDDVPEQVQSAIEPTHNLYPNDDHIFVFDNVQTHAK